MPTQYSSPDDLLLGNIPLPSYIDTTKLVEDTADEIDSQLGYVYVTPFDLDPMSSTLSRPAQLLLKRISRNLATGRLILQVASSDENKNLHSYGWMLVNEALAALKCIAEGEVILEGAPSAVGAATPAITSPQISNLDAESNVEAFYNRIANPDYSYGPYWPARTNPDGLVM